MITVDSLPKGYLPYQALTLCSNKLIGGTKVVSVGKVLPLLIGKGAKPQIWIQALQFPKSKKYILLVDASISRHPLVRVEELGSQIVVKVNGGIVLRVEQTGDDQAVVDELDLRSLGFNVYGGVSELNVGNITFSNSTFNQVGVMVGIER
ncbi:hypothetical protein C7A07_23995 [Pseudomonas fragi]|nr:hypothetical protein C7A07_23995 [Pseudomonas fragi]